MLRVAGIAFPFALLPTCFQPWFGVSGGPWSKSEGSLLKGTAFVRAMLTHDAREKSIERSDGHADSALISMHKKFRNEQELEGMDQ